MKEEKATVYLLQLSIYTVSGVLYIYSHDAAYRAAYIIIQRVANKSAFTSNTVASGQVISFKVRSRGQFTDGSGTLPDTSSVDKYEMSSRKLEVGVDTTIDFHWDKI